MVALDRPGYGSSAPYPEAMALPEQRVDLAYGAVDRILGDRPRGAGLFLMGHSGGCELVMRMGADERGRRSAGHRTGRHGPALSPGGPGHPENRDARTPPGRPARAAVASGGAVSAGGSHRGHGLSDRAVLRGPDGVRLGAQGFSGARPRRACPGALQHRRARKGLAERFVRDDRDRRTCSPARHGSPCIGSPTRDTT